MKYCLRMEHYWKAAGIKPEVSKRLEGCGSSESDYKYNSLMVLSLDPAAPPLYYFPRHSAGEWIVKLKGLFLTITSLSDDILSEEGVESLCSKNSNNEKKSVSSDLSSRKSDHRLEEDVEIYNVKLQVQGGPVHCCIAHFSDHIFVLSSDSCVDMSTCVLYLHNILPHFVPFSHNTLLNSASDITHVVDAYVTPALEMIGVREWVTLPYHHRDRVVSQELENVLLDLETQLDMEAGRCVSCGGLLIVAHPDIVYNSLPRAISHFLLETLYFRELLTLTQGYVIWFNRLYRHNYRVKKQDWYVLTVAKNGMCASQLVGAFGDLQKEQVTRMARDLEELLDTHSTEIRQHLPSPPIKLRYTSVLGFKYGDNCAFYCETRYQGVVEYHHAQEDRARVGRYVVALEDGVHVAQRTIANKLFTVAYNSSGVHDIDTMFRELGI